MRRWASRVDTVTVIAMLAAMLATQGGRVGSAVMAMTVAAVLLAGCEGSDDGAPDSAQTTAVTDAATLTVHAVPLSARLVRVAGHLPDRERSSVVERLTRGVRSWLDGGFVEGDYPRSDFSAAFSGFTPGAARQARRQQRITTNAALGRDLVQVVPTRQAVGFSVFAPQGRAAGATAAVRLVLLGIRADRSEVEVAVSGKLYLTREKGWRVFGFDLQRDVGAPGTSVTGRG